MYVFHVFMCLQLNYNKPLNYFNYNSGSVPAYQTDFWELLSWYFLPLTLVITLYYYGIEMSVTNWFIDFSFSRIWVKSLN